VRGFTRREQAVLVCVLVDCVDTLPRSDDARGGVASGGQNGQGQSFENARARRKEWLRVETNAATGRASVR
jgi:hypothetical protein